MRSEKKGEKTRYTRSEEPRTRYEHSGVRQTTKRKVASHATTTLSRPFPPLRHTALLHTETIRKGPNAVEWALVRKKEREREFGSIDRTTANESIDVQNTTYVYTHIHIRTTMHSHYRN